LKSAHYLWQIDDSGMKQRQNKPTEAKQVKKDIVPPAGCFTIIGMAWLVWLVIDLAHLGVFSGKEHWVDAVIHMPSIGIPIVVSIGIAVVSGRAWLISHRKKAFPKEPWMWERNWSRTGIQSAITNRAINIILVAIAITQGTAIAFFVIFFLPEARVPTLAAAPFVVATVGIWIWCAVELTPVLRFGRPFFRYGAFPFFVGTTLEGRLEKIDRITTFDLITTTLRCVMEKPHTWGRSQKIRREIVSEQVQLLTAADVVERSAGGNSREHREGRILPIRFGIPNDAKGTRMLESPVRKWELEVTIQSRGANYNATFLLPIYNRQYSKPVDA
jgi:hypothetical protein